MLGLLQATWMISVSVIPVTIHILILMLGSIKRLMGCQKYHQLIMFQTKLLYFVVVIRRSVSNVNSTSYYLVNKQILICSLIHYCVYSNVVDLTLKCTSPHLSVIEHCSY